MLRRERFGRFVLLEEREAVHLGTTQRAVRLGPSGVDRVVSLLRYSEAVSSRPDAAARLMDQTRGLARLQIPGVLRVLGIGRVEQSYYASYELLEGRSLQAVIARSRTERFPISAENALMVASRAAIVLEALHALNDDTGVPLFHGLLTPCGILVSWEGEVRVREVGLWTALRDTGVLGHDERGALAPEQAVNEVGDERSDVYALGLVLLEMLARWSPDGSDPLEAVSQARLTSVTGEEEPLPPPVNEVLRRALAPEPGSRYATMGEMRQEIDALLFSGDFTPTTFNLAFFMQTLFREDMERETRALEEARGADYTDLLPVPSPASPTTMPGPAPADVPVAESEPPFPAPVESLLTPPPPPPGEAAPENPADDPEASGRRSRPAGRRTRALPPGGSGHLFAQTSKRGGGRRRRVLLAGLVVAAAVGGGGIYLRGTPRRQVAPPAPASTLGPDAAAAFARVRELEARLAELEREKAEMAAAGRVGATESGAPSPDPPEPAPSTGAARPDASAVAAQARAEARRQERAVAARREEEIRLLEAEIQAAQSRLVAEQGEAAAAADLAAPLPAITTPLPTPEPLPPPTTLPSVVPGQIVDAADPGLKGGDLLAAGPLVQYPPAALMLGRSAEVLVEALVEEDGSIREATALESSVTGLGFEEAAVRQVRGRRYGAATKNEVPVRVRVRIRVRFTP